MRTRIVALDGAQTARGTVVVIDVLRAFTTAAVAFERGAAGIVLVRELHEALAASRTEPGSLAMGEVDGRMPAGFDLSNSPEEVSRLDLTGRTIYHRTTAGTRGAAAASGAGALAVASFACAEATAAWVAERDRGEVTFVATGIHDELDGDEDVALADYLTELLAGRRPDPGPFLERVRRSDAGRRFTDDAQPQYRPGDLEIACQVDRVDLAMVGTPEPGRVVVRPSPRGR